MPQKVNVKGSRAIRKNSRKNSKKSSHKSIVNQIEEQPQYVQQNQFANLMGQPNMMGQYDMMNPMMGMDQQQMMMQSQMMMQQPQFNQMMMGNSRGESDPLHLQHLAPSQQHSGMNFNNYGISYDQLTSGENNNGLASKFNSVQQQMNQRKL